MDTRTVEQVNQWESRPFTGGLAGLRELTDEGFSGAVRAAGTWVFVLNGRVIGVFEGELEDLEGQDGTAYRAPDQSLALLFTMQELGGKTQAKYYTNDTPLSEVHETLTNANFSGYVELSENVLSGDYYTAYYGGRSMSAAFVGESERLLTGEEAFDRADDEVGIYEVKKVDIDVLDLSEIVDDPEPEPEPDVTSEPEPEQTVEPDAKPSANLNPEVDVEPESRPESESPTEQHERAAETQEPVQQDPAPSSLDTTADPQETVQQEPVRSEPEIADAGETVETPDSVEDDSGSSPSGGTNTSAAGSSPKTDQEESRSDDMFSEEQQWRQARAIPSLDPSRSGNGGPRGAQRSKTTSKKSVTKDRLSTKSRSQTKGRSATSERSKPTPEERSKPSNATGQSSAEESDDGASVAAYEQALQQSKQEIDRLNDQLSKAKSEKQELLAQREELRSEVDRLTAELQQAKANESKSGASGSQSLPADQALEGTNLFVRYTSKSQPTLEDARQGADREEVNTNLSLEHHTQFDADDVVVGGVEFEAFLQESIQYRFVEWLVEDLLYEIRDTGHVGQLRELFDVIPKIDRAELSGNATIRKTEDGEEVRTQRTFDVILRDRMGNPLVVANLNDARDPATGGMMADLVAAANDVGETSPSLSAAVFVTASFFEPEALETAAEATGGGLLSREKKESYVKLSRKRGYHLCLVETRGGQFHVNVPEL